MVGVGGRNCLIQGCWGVLKQKDDICRNSSIPLIADQLRYQREQEYVPSTMFSVRVWEQPRCKLNARATKVAWEKREFTGTRIHGALTVTVSTVSLAQGKKSMGIKKKKSDKVYQTHKHSTIIHILKLETQDLPSNDILGYGRKG